ncbi:MAG: class I SAM-dependent methyltransferase [Clostridia bacterium]|nr:class I SAM-dependent methyltransferase [Clostridia bacterium]
MNLKDIKNYCLDSVIPLISEETENLLKLIISIKKPLKVLEIGTAVGYSAALMLTYGAQSVYSIEIDENRFFQAKQNLKDLGFEGRAALYLGDASQILPSITGSYDFVFIDGPKGQYINYIPYILNLISLGGVIICDNINYRGLVDGSVKMKRNSLTMVNNLRKFIEYITTDSRLITQIFDIAEGVSLSCKISG